MARARSTFLLILGLAAITFPFLWLILAPNFTTSTVGVIWAPSHAIQFFSDLAPVFILALIGWFLVQANRYYSWGAKLRQKSAAMHPPLTQYWGWIILPLVLSSTFFLNDSSLGLFSMVAIYMLLAQGLNITVGMTGLLVLGYAAFFAFGAYFLALGQQNFLWFTWWEGAPLAFILGGGVGYLLGLPCLRLRGDYLAIVTLGFAEAFRETMRNLDFTGGDNGISLSGGAVFPHRLSTPLGVLNDSQFAYLVLIVVVLFVFLFIQRIYHSPIGQAWIAIRENEIAAASLGIPVVQMKLLAFSLSAAIAALAGVLYAAKNRFVNPATCDFQTSIMVLAMVILGGLGNTYGALLGATLLYLVPQLIEFLPSMIQNNATLNALTPNFVIDSLRHLSDYRLLLFGAIMVLMMLYRPQGLLGSAKRKLEITEGEEK